MAADAVQRLFDRQHIRIDCRLLYKLNNRIKRHVWMMQKNIAAADLCENILLVVHARHRLRLIRLITVLIHAFYSVQLHQERQIQRPVDPVNIVFFYIKFLLQDLEQLRIHLILDLQADDLAPLALFQLLLDFL